MVNLRDVKTLLPLSGCTEVRIVFQSHYGDYKWSPSNFFNLIYHNIHWFLVTTRTFLLSLFKIESMDTFRTKMFHSVLLYKEKPCFPSIVLTNTKHIVDCLQIMKYQPIIKSLINSEIIECLRDTLSSLVLSSLVEVKCLLLLLSSFNSLRYSSNHDERP